MMAREFDENPRSLAGCWIVAINLPKLFLVDNASSFDQRLQTMLDLAVTAHRQKRLFISRLMAYGNRGPLQFLRHKIHGHPFLKIDQASQSMQLIGLAEAAALRNGSPKTTAQVLGSEAQKIVTHLRQAIDCRNQIHKLNMHLSDVKNESAAYRLASLDLREFGQSSSSYLLRQKDQSTPIYSQGVNLLAFMPLSWRQRFKIEGQLHAQLDGPHALVLFLKDATLDDISFAQMLYQAAISAKISKLQLAPDLQVCRTCYMSFHNQSACPSCKSSLISPFGYCQTDFSPVHTWCLGKRSEWKIRHRIDDHHIQIQQELPW